MCANSVSLLHLIQVLNRAAQNGTVVVSVSCTKKTYKFALLLVREGYLLRCVVHREAGQRMLRIYLKYDSSGKVVYSQITPFSGYLVLSSRKQTGSGVLGRSTIIFSSQGRFFLSRRGSLVQANIGPISPVAQIL